MKSSMLSQTCGIAMVHRHSLFYMAAAVVSEYSRKNYYRADEPGQTALRQMLRFCAGLLNDYPASFLANTERNYSREAARDGYLYEEFMAVVENHLMWVGGADDIRKRLQAIGQNDLSDPLL
jgi:hypothetical protein